MTAIDDARALLTANGYVVLKEASYRKAQERQRMAKVLEDAERDRREDVERWARQAWGEVRRISDRLTVVYGIAMAHGATDDDLRGPDTNGIALATFLREHSTEIVRTIRDADVPADAGIEAGWPEITRLLDNLLHWPSAEPEVVTP